MIIKQIIYCVSYIYWLYLYPYLITPLLLLNKTNTLNISKKYFDSLSNTVLINGFKTDFYFRQNDNISFDENLELIDVVISNHMSSIDFLFSMVYLKNLNINKINYVFKKEFIYMPAVGFITYLNTDIKLNRNWDKDKHTIGKQIDNIKPTKEKQIIIIFPEGTRITPTKLKEAQEFSIKNNLPIYNNLLVPKVKGIWAIINHLKQTNRLGKLIDLSLIAPKCLGNSIYMSDLKNLNIGPIYGMCRELNLDNIEYQNIDVFKNWLFKNWMIKDNLIGNYSKFTYEKIEDKHKYTNLIKLTILCVLITLLINNKYGRYYLLLMFILAYLLMIFNLFM
jgi:hypothetical protein